MHPMHPAAYPEEQAPPSYNNYPQPLRRLSTDRTCLAYAPWTAILSSILVFIGIGFWVNNGVEGGKSAKGALSVLGVSYSNSKLVEQAIVGTSVVMIFLLLAIVAVSFYRCWLEYRRDTEGRLDKASGYLALNFTINTALWVMIMWVFIAFGIFAVAAVASYALDRGAKASIQTIDKQLGTAKNVYDAAEAFVTSYEATFNKTTGADPFEDKVSDLKKLLKERSKNCLPYCLDLSKLTFLKGNTCICDSLKLRAAQDKANAAWRALIPSTVGLIIIFIGLTFMLMNLVAQFVRTQSDVKWTRDTEEVLLDAGQQYYSEKSQQFFMQP